ncbi:endonuclease/exonuclease/phosphatase family protein [Paeniglutamicibacter sp. Y32M11]|uniref:endonuclease/exonuclease/phosphatase family protein n=1 Tax=Paeniglutamicibacter sp. Y32M11 TaxID=2853258 RepID=UPI001C52FEA2|nr:endonuclease/exonuclease/phosphatase family protein [Paeniglutamicibacter sp. Y32M11]QXQ09729.1 endonuclease/exonuclease/phosphatase family protein [Paeniglutamicibacter sp. Y32M11]
MSSNSALPRVATRSRHRRTRSHRFLRFLVILGALSSALLIAFHQRVPDLFGLGLLLDNFAPWLGLAVLVVGLFAIISRSRTSLVVFLIPVLTWLFTFGPGIIPLSWTAPAAASSTLTLGSQNIKAGTGTATESALDLASGSSDIIALQELDENSAQRVTSALEAQYPHHFVVGTVGVWSKYPLVNSRALDLGLGWKRALSAQVQTGAGNIQIYVVHAASARPNDHVDRDEMLSQLAMTVSADSHQNIIALGDFNATSTDRAFQKISDVLDEPNQDNGLFGFTWPQTPFAMMRLDHVLVRGLDVTSNITANAGLSDHRAVLTTVNLPGN